MRYRRLSLTGDYSFGKGRLDFLVDSPEAVAQSISTRLKLFTGEWFLDITEGTPYAEQILGENTAGTYDQAIRRRILETQGVRSIVEYTSSRNAARKLSVKATVDTIFGRANVGLTV